MLAIGIAYSYNRIVYPARAQKMSPHSLNHIEINKDGVLDAFTRKYQLSPDCRRLHWSSTTLSPHI